MQKKTVKIVSLILCLSVFFSVFCFGGIQVSAKTSAQWQQEIDKLKKQKASDAEMLSAVQSKISAINSEIAAYNKKINGINATIEANKAEIKKSENEIEADKLAYKKRIRSIYMSGSDSSVRVLLGSESFSQFLQMSQLTSSISSHDRQLMEDLVTAIKALEDKNAQNEKLRNEQISLREKVQQQQAALKSEEAQAQALYNATTGSLANAEAQYKAAKAAEDAAIAARAKGGSGAASTPSFVNSSGAFLWPVSGYYNISAGYKSNDAVHKGSHNGIDIAGGGISGQPIRATSDGYVSYVSNSCSHNYKKNGSCGCGGGYGNYCIINHGSVNGATYSAYYAHAASIVVSPGQKVTKGQTIGYVGTTGWSTGYHLHFGVMRNGGWINPISLSYSK